jgi:hypothetical protein
VIVFWELPTLACTRPAFRDMLHFVQYYATSIPARPYRLRLFVCPVLRWNHKTTCTRASSIPLSAHPYAGIITGIGKWTHEHTPPLGGLLPSCKRAPRASHDLHAPPCRSAAIAMLRPSGNTSICRHCWEHIHWRKVRRFDTNALPSPTKLSRQKLSSTDTVPWQAVFSHIGLCPSFGNVSSSPTTLISLISILS